MKVSTADHNYRCDTCTYTIKPGEAFVDFAGFTAFTGGICFGCIKTMCEEIEAYREGVEYGDVSYETTSSWARLSRPRKRARECGCVCTCAGECVCECPLGLRRGETSR
jgi:hypothetical protein